MGKLRMLSTFAGIGGLDLGAAWTGGIETVGFVEQDPFCQQVLRKHWPDVPQFGDIHDVSARTLADAGITDIDIICGGFPCQPVSHAGKRKAQADARWLWPEMARLIGEVKPHWAVIENVPGLLTTGIDDILGDLDALGYDAGTLVFPAAAVGAPHLRERVFVMAHSSSVGREWHSSPGWEAQRWTEYAGSADVAHSDGDGQHRGAESAPGRDDLRRVGPNRPNADGRHRDVDDADQSGWRGREDRAGGGDADPDFANGQEGAIQPAATDAGTLADASSSGWGTCQRDLYTGQQHSCGNGKIVADTPCQCDERDGRTRDRGAEHTNAGIGLAVAGGAGFPERQGTPGERAYSTTPGSPPGQTQSGICRITHGVPTGLDRVIRSVLDAIPWPTPPGPEQYPDEPPRTVTGKVPHRAARLKALGNAVVPAQCFPLFAILVYVDALLRQEEEAA